MLAQCRRRGVRLSNELGRTRSPIDYTGQRNSHGDKGRKHDPKQDPPLPKEIRYRTGASRKAVGSIKNTDPRVGKINQRCEKQDAEEDNQRNSDTNRDYAEWKRVDHSDHVAQPNESR